MRRTGIGCLIHVGLGVELCCAVLCCAVLCCAVVQPVSRRMRPYTGRASWTRGGACGNPGFMCEARLDKIRGFDKRDRSEKETVSRAGRTRRPIFLPYYLPNKGVRSPSFVVSHPAHDHPRPQPFKAPCRTVHSPNRAVPSGGSGRATTCLAAKTQGGPAS